MKTIIDHFTKLTQVQELQYEALQALYEEWNQKINVISRKDISNLYEHHVLHSLLISKFFNPIAGTRFLDFGTGGGFPGIPLAIMWPDCQFHLIDGTGKKIKVVEEVCKAIGLKNVHASHVRGEEEKGKYDFIVSRAVMPLRDMVKIVRKNISKEQHNAIGNGILSLKGGDITSEILPFIKIIEVTPLSQYTNLDWYKEKYLIYLPI